MTKNKKWFIKIRGSYLPKSWQAVLLYALYLAYLMWVLIYVFNTEVHLWSAILILVPNWVAACVVISWIASKKS
jgi:hypothetical protein